MSIWVELGCFLSSMEGEGLSTKFGVDMFEGSVFKGLEVPPPMQYLSLRILIEGISKSKVIYFCSYLKI